MGIPIEILGYKIDYKKMQKLIDKNYITNEKRSKLELEKIKEKCIQNGITLPDNFIEKYNPNKMYPSQYLHQIITKNKENKKYIDEDAWNESKIFYRKYMSNPSAIFYINMDDLLPDFEKASELIKKAGGLVFIPHIFEYRDNSKKILKYILENYEIDGIECFYTTFSEEQSNYLLSFAEKHNLLISGGSDYHGLNKKDHNLGIGRGNLNISKQIISNWEVKDYNDK